MSQLTEEQAPIDAAIVNAMIESTPENWNEILLTLIRNKPQKDIGAFLHELTSPEGYPPVGPADSLFDATFKLDQLIQSHKGVVSRATYIAKNNGENWSFSVEFEYASKPL